MVLVAEIQYDHMISKVSHIRHASENIKCVHKVSSTILGEQWGFPPVLDKRKQKQNFLFPD